MRDLQDICKYMCVCVSYIQFIYVQCSYLYCEFVAWAPVNVFTRKMQDTSGLLPLCCHLNDKDATKLCHQNEKDATSFCFWFGHIATLPLCFTPTLGLP